MDCEHKNLKSENCRIFCLDCGAELPPETLKNRADHKGEESKEDIEKPKRKKGTK